LTEAVLHWNLIPNNAVSIFEQLCQSRLLLDTTDTVLIDFK
jgi:hypothetical protein